MAIRLIDVYPATQVNPGDPDYPGGSGKNVSAPGLADGTPFDEVWFNDIQGLLAALLAQAGIAADGNPETAQDSQYVAAIQAVSLAATQPLVQPPVTVTPVDGADIGTTTPTLVTNDFQALYGRTHLASEYRIGTGVSGDDVTGFVGLSGTLGAVTQWVVSPSLATGDVYYWQARYQNEDSIWSNWGVPTSFSLPSLSVQTPTNLLPVDLDTSVTDTVTLTADAFVLIPPGGEDHDGSQWQITTDVGFVSIDFDSGQDAVNLVSFTQAGLALNLTTYYWRVRYHDSNFGWSDFSTPFSFTTVTETVQQPSNVTPTNGTVDVGSSVQLTGDSFTPIGSFQTHDASQWQAGNSDFSTIYFDSGTDAVNLETINATGWPDGTTTVYWRVRYEGSVTGFSAWSTPFTFVTKLVFADWPNWDGTNDGTPVFFSTQSVQYAAAHMSKLVKVEDNKHLLFDVFSDTTSATHVTLSGLVPSVSARVSAAVSLGREIAAVCRQNASEFVGFAVAGNNIESTTIDTSGATPSLGSAEVITSGNGGNRAVACLFLSNDLVAVTWIESSTQLGVAVLDFSGGPVQVSDILIIPSTSSTLQEKALDIASIDGSRVLIAAHGTDRTFTYVVDVSVVDFSGTPPSVGAATSRLTSLTTADGISVSVVIMDDGDALVTSSGESLVAGDRYGRTYQRFTIGATSTTFLAELIEPGAVSTSLNPSQVSTTVRVTDTDVLAMYAEADGFKGQVIDVDPSVPTPSTGIQRTVTTGQGANANAQVAMSVEDESRVLLLFVSNSSLGTIDVKVINGEP